MGKGCFFPGAPWLERERRLIALFNDSLRARLRIEHCRLYMIQLQFRSFFESGICSQTESTGPTVEFKPARELVFWEPLREQLPRLVAAKAAARGEVAVLAKKCVALRFCMTDLFDGYVAIVCIQALLSPLFRRAAEILITEPAGLEKVFSAAPRMRKELVRKRPGLETELTFPSQQV